MNQIKQTLIGLIVTSIVGIVMTYVLKMMEKGDFIVNEHEQTIKSCIINSNELHVTLNDIGGLEKIKDEIQHTIILPLKYPLAFSSFKMLQQNRGSLFHGPPGTGKTMLVKAIANESNVPLISLSASTLESKWFGESNKLISAAFDVARSIQPSIIFFDEIDGLGKTRSSFDQSCVSTFKTELLSKMDGMESKTSDTFFIMGCTNNIANLDPALKRRLPNQYNISLPSQEDRFNIIKIITSEEKYTLEEIKSLSEMTSNYSGSDLNSLYKRLSNKRLREYFKDEEFIKKLNTTSKMYLEIKKLDINIWKEDLGFLGDEEQPP